MLDSEETSGGGSLDLSDSVSLTLALEADSLALTLEANDPLNTLYVSQSGIPFYRVVTTARRREMTTHVRRVQPSLSGLAGKLRGGNGGTGRHRRFLNSKRSYEGSSCRLISDSSAVEEELVATIEWKQTLLFLTPKDASVSFNDGSNTQKLSKEYLKRRWPFSR